MVLEADRPTPSAAHEAATTFLAHCAWPPLHFRATSAFRVFRVGTQPAPADPRGGGGGSVKGGAAPAAEG